MVICGNSQALGIPNIFEADTQSKVCWCQGMFNGIALQAIHTCLRQVHYQHLPPNGHDNGHV